MHYKDGTEVKLGDLFKEEVIFAQSGSPSRKTTTFGIVANKSPGSETCNIEYVPVARVTEVDGEKMAVPLQFLGSTWSATAGNCEKVA